MFNPAHLAIEVAPPREPEAHGVRRESPASAEPPLELERDAGAFYRLAQELAGRTAGYLLNVLLDSHK
jgi:hypothetical protein